MAARARFAGLQVLAGALVWAVHFVAVYGITSLLCARGAATLTWLGFGIVAWAVFAVTGLALAALVAVFLAARRGAARGDFLPWITAGIAALAALAIVWEALPAMLVPACE